MPAQTPTSIILRIDRSITLETWNKRVEGFFNGWEVRHQDERSLALSEIDLSRISLESMLRLREHAPLTVGTKHRRTKQEPRLIRLDLQVLLNICWRFEGVANLWADRVTQEPSLDNVMIDFDGTVLISDDPGSALWVPSLQIKRLPDGRILHATRIHAFGQLTTGYSAVLRTV